MSASYPIGDWLFDPAAHELRRGDERVRVESRAAAVLGVLIERRGAIVSKDELLSRVWDDRQVSDHSIAVVIGDLRRALGDDARSPSYIETVPKSGYRLVAEPPVAPAGSRPSGRPAKLAAGFAVAAIAVGAFALPLQDSAGPVVLLETIRNDTGSAAYDPLAAASGGSVLASLSAHSGIRVTRSPADDPAVRLSGRLVLWSGRPELLLEAQDPASKRLIWSAQIFVPEPEFPSAIDREISRLDNAIGPR